jgi:hypothetical protein
MGFNKKSNYTSPALIVASLPQNALVIRQVPGVSKNALSSPPR